jgi:hypothetical protein
VLILTVGCNDPQSATTPPAAPHGGSNRSSGCSAPPVRLLAPDPQGHLKASTLPAPLGVGRGVVIEGLAAISRSDVWAVGSTGPLVGTYALAAGSVIAHWDGETWSLIPHPNPSQSSLVSVAAISPNDVWAVGARSGSIPPGVSVARTLVEHWDGHRWRVVPSPNQHGSGQLTSLAVLASRDVWAAGGSHSGGEEAPDEALVEHWQGSRWVIVHVPYAGRVGYTGDLAATSSSSVWVDAYDGHNLDIARWDGHHWRAIHHVPIDSLLYPIQHVYHLTTGFATPSSTRWHLIPRGSVRADLAGIGITLPITLQRQIRLAHSCGR